LKHRGSTKPGYDAWFSARANKLGNAREKFWRIAGYKCAAMNCVRRTYNYLRNKTMRIARTALIAFTTFAAATATACGSSSSSTSGGGIITDPPAANAVVVSNDKFTPTSLQVAAGTTVTWTWASGSVGHNVTFDDGVHSATQSGGTYTRTFTTAGTYAYHCTIHGTPMSGTVTVQ
jgi:plastocyanin